MSVRVLVIPEDPQLNGYILRPLMQAILADAGKPKARITILTRPRLRGFAHAVEAIRQDLAIEWGHFDVWVFVPDADEAKTAAMGALESDLRGKGVALICCIAQPEVEIYACAGADQEMGLSWQQARDHHRLKEEVFGPLLASEGDPRAPGQGREQLTRRAVANLPHLYQLCPELRTLRNRLAEHLATRD